MASGANVVAQALIPAQQAACGYFIAPIVFEVKPDMSIWREEGVLQCYWFRNWFKLKLNTYSTFFLSISVFGPVLSLMIFDSEAEAVIVANDSCYGLVLKNDFVSPFFLFKTLLSWGETY